MADELTASLGIAKEEHEDTLLTVSEAAKIADRHVNTIRNWIYAGHLPAQKVGDYGRFKIKKSDLEATLIYRPPSRNEGDLEETSNNRS